MEGSGMAFKRILCAVDFSEMSLEAFTNASPRGACSARLSLWFATQPLFLERWICRDRISTRGAVLAADDVDYVDFVDQVDCGNDRMGTRSCFIRGLRDANQ